MKRKRGCFKDRPKESEAGQGREIDTSCGHCIRDDEGKDRICPHCLDDLATMFV